MQLSAILGRTSGGKRLAAVAFACAVGAMLCIGAPSALAEPTTSTEALEELNAQQASLDEASNRYFAALADYQGAVEERDAAQAKLDDIEARLAEAQERLGNRARELYRAGTGSWMEILLGSTSFGDFTRNLDLINLMNQNDAALIQEERDLRAESREQQAVLEEHVQRTSHSADEAYNSFREAEDLMAQIQATYQSLSAEEQAFVLAQAQAQADAQAQQASNDQLVAQAVAESGGTVNADGSVTDSSGNTYSSPSAYSAATGNDIVARAMSQLGSSYVWGGVGGASGGYDCSGFVSYALTGTNTRLGTTATFNSWNEVSDPQPGDVAVIHEANGSQHTGIYIGNGQMVHAADENTGVVVSNVQDGMKFVRQ